MFVYFGLGKKIFLNLSIYIDESILLKYTGFISKSMYLYVLKGHIHF